MRRETCVTVNAPPRGPAILLGPFDRLHRPTGDAETDRRHRLAHAALLKHAVPRRFAMGDLVVLEGEPADYLGVVQSGELAVSTSTVAPSDDDMDHKVLVTRLRILSPNRTFGEVGLARASGVTGLRGARTATIRAETNVEIRALSYTGIDEARRRHPEITEIVLMILSDLVRELSRDVAGQRSTSTEALLRKELFRIASDDQRATPVGASTMHRIRVSQREIADMLGVGRARVNQLLAAERSAGRVETRPGASEILVDLDALASAIDG